MAVFRYSAVKGDGSVLNGELEANDRSEAVQRLGRQGLQPVKIESADAVPVAKGAAGLKAMGKGKGKEAGKNGAPLGPVKLKRGQVVMFTEELSDLLAAGLQLEPALKVMESREELSALKDVTILLRQQVRDGASFSRSLRSSSPSFGELYCNMAAAGEISGALPTILKRQAEYLNTLQDLQNKVIFAMIYPAFLVASGVGVTVLFVTFLIPQLMSLLESTQSGVPPAAQAMITASDFVKSYWWIFVILIVLGVTTVRILIRDPKRKLKWHELQLSFPLTGKVLRSRFFVQSTETLANLVGNGLPLLKGLELTRDTTLNLYLREKMTRLIGIVGEGGSLSRGMKRVGFFPPLLIDMIAVGEQTGDLEVALQRAATRYDKELSKSIERMSAMVQPLIVVIMASIVGVMAYMMISIIFETISGLGR
ncbi:MAG TPA: type II secretion system F family protein [Verrucomicrobiales bacterium]|nr:type II secretion system F family protein [Verrucomicrobiales bacterium]